MKKTPIAKSFISDSSRKLARHLEVEGRDQHQQLRYSCSIRTLCHNCAPQPQSVEIDTKIFLLIARIQTEI